MRGGKLFDKRGETTGGKRSGSSGRARRSQTRLVRGLGKRPWARKKIGVSEVAFHLVSKCQVYQMCVCVCIFLFFSVLLGVSGWRAGWFIAFSSLAWFT